jgi:ABC-2 type transport system permease protein
MNRQVIGAMVRLRLLRVVRDRGGLVWLLVMPMVFSYLMGALMGDWSSAGPQRRYKVLVFDQDGGAAVERLLVPVAADERFAVVSVDSAVTEARARALVDDGAASAVLQVPPGFTAAFAGGPAVDLRLSVDGNRLSSQNARTLIERSLLRLNTERAARELVAAPGAAVPRDRAAAFDTAAFAAAWEHPRLRLDSATLGRLETEDWGLTRSRQHVGPAYVLFFMMMFMMVSAKDLVKERQDHTLARLVISRASALDLVAGYFLGGLVIGVVQGAILLGLNAVAFGLDYGDSPAALILVVVLFAGFASAASILLGTLARTGPQADGLGSGLSMTFGAIGGLWWPLEIVPPFMQAIGHALPTGQAITVFHGMIGRGWGVGQSLPMLGGLLVWFVVILTLAARQLRRQATA